jgi:hypothetical protein
VRVSIDIKTDIAKPDHPHEVKAMTGENIAHRSSETKAEAVNLRPVYLPETPLALFGCPDDLKLVQQARERDSRAAKPVFQDLEGNDIQIVSDRRTKDGKEYQFGDGTREAVNKDGSLRIDYKDGHGLTGKMEKDGSWSEKHWGTEASRKEFVWTFYTRTLSPDGTEKVVNESGNTGRITYPWKPGDPFLVIDAWGPTANDNYTSFWGNHSERRIYANGSDSTVPR